MRRLHLFEIEDQTWCPGFLRDAMTDYLRLVHRVSRPYRGVARRLQAALTQTGTHRVIDLGSGGGGPWLELREEFEADGFPVEVCLTDRYPNLSAFEKIEADSQGRVQTHKTPVDATQVPPELDGFRTLFSSFHHFPPEQAQAILRDAAQQRRGIAVLEATERSPRALLLMGIMPLMVLILMPAVRPFRLSRLFWTYLVPILPLAIFFDGIVSCLRTNTPAELRAMTDELALPGYRWDISQVKHEKSPIPVTCLLGTPIP